MDVTGGAVDTAKTFETKMELGSRYGMEGKVDNNGDGVMLEWDAQAKAFEEYVVGKTAAEVKAIQTQEAGGHLIAVDEALLKAGCSMQITDFITAVAKACEDKAAVSFKAGEGFKLGVAAKSTAAESKAASAEGNGSVNMYSDFGAAVVGADGKILAALNDATQPKIAIDTNGAIVEASYKGTKRELGSAYGMEGKVDNDGNGVMKEWDAQSAAFSAFCAGKTAAEVSGLKTQEANGHHIAVDKELLDAGCSMQITGMQTAIAQAATYAR
jgi:3D (Asp-Asp-Asp) domain-containing protein